MPYGLLIWLVDDCLTSVAEVEAIEARLVERRRAERVPGDAPRRRRREERPHRARADREQNEEQDRVVVREAIAELAPPGILIEKIHGRRNRRRKSDDDVEPPSVGLPVEALRPEEPEIQRRREP